MDERRFDQIVKSLSEAGSRRGVLFRLVGLPLSGALAYLLGTSGDAKRRQKRKERGKHSAGAENHKHEHRRRKHNVRHKHHEKKSCKPASLAETCAGRCGPVKNACKKTVDCGSCLCDPACPACQSCDSATGQCQPDPAQAGDVCGDGLICHDGACTCQGASCGGCRVCADGACVPDSRIVCQPLDPCHTAGVCDPATGACTNPVLPNGTECAGGVCREGTCVPCGSAIDDFCCRDTANELFCYGTMDCAFFGQCVDSCGHLNDFCCLDAVCHDSLICAFFGECIESCGHLNDFCCHNAAQGYFCHDALECSYFTECIAACGGDGEFCCHHGACDDGFTCDAEARCRPNG